MQNEHAYIFEYSPETDYLTRHNLNCDELVFTVNGTQNTIYKFYRQAGKKQFGAFVEFYNCEKTFKNFEIYADGKFYTNDPVNETYRDNILFITQNGTIYPPSQFLTVNRSTQLIGIDLENTDIDMSKPFEFSFD